MRLTNHTQARTLSHRFFSLSYSSLWSNVVKYFESYKNMFKHVRSWFFHVFFFFFLLNILFVLFLFIFTTYLNMCYDNEWSNLYSFGKRNIFRCFVHRKLFNPYNPYHLCSNQYCRQKNCDFIVFFFF